ncbi:MAG: nucleotide exchange factor GrpE [Muriicola sp.]|nr:nucleotide exchange factor GrpE [Muriicola sp.]
MSKKDKTEEIEELENELHPDETQVEENKEHSDQQDTEETSPLSEKEQLEAELEKEKDKFLRLFAEFENFKRRTSKERIDLFKTAGQEVIVSLLPVLDDFERALNELGKSSEKELFKGVELIYNKFKDTLKAKGLGEVQAKEGDAFDAEIHDAITQIPAPNKKLKGKIIDVVEKGYSLGDKIIRHPKVVVGN